MKKKIDSKMRNVELLIIDPQVDFCSPEGALYVPGAEDDMKRLSSFIDHNISEISHITVTLDTHNLIDVSHPAFWRNENGMTPSPFTIISEDDVDKGKWVPYDTELKNKMSRYVKLLARQQDFQLCIWPPHCLIGSIGGNIESNLYKSLINWQTTQMSNIEYVYKGMNVYTEHYGALCAEVPDPIDDTTKGNWDLVKKLMKADDILVSGEAGSHCVKATLEQLYSLGGSECIRKVILLTDTISPVIHPNINFAQIQNNFVSEMQDCGMRTASAVSPFFTLKN